MSKLGQRIIVLGVAAVVAACAAAPGSQDFAFTQPAPAQEFTLVVQNDYLGEVDIYAVTGSSRMRLGSVMSGRTAQLRVPRALMARPEIQFQADPLGPISAFTFPQLVVPPGATVELMVAPTLRMSSYSVW